MSIRATWKLHRAGRPLAALARPSASVLVAGDSNGARATVLSGLLSSLLGLALCMGAFGAVRADPVQEDMVKAAVVFKLTRYVDWPESQSVGDEGDVLRLCALGDSSVVDALETVDGRPTRGAVVRYTRVASLADAGNCHVLFIADRAAEIRSLIDEAASEAAGHDVPAPILTVSDLEGFVDRGGIVEVTRRGTRLGFRISVENARSAGLLISAPLLELAEIVDG